MMRSLLLLGALAIASPALADDHVIRPDCWEENVGSEVHRHCDVPRTARPPAARPPVYADGSPPPAAPPPPQYYGWPPLRAWPGSSLCAYGPPPCPVYYDYAPAPPVPPLYPAYPPPPFFYFGFGPFGFWVP
jgi:hypothetical protein